MQLWTGSGVLLSAGLLDSIPSSDWADCAARLRCGPSDFRVATCVQNLGGVSFGDWNAPVVRMDIYRYRASCALFARLCASCHSPSPM